MLHVLPRTPASAAENMAFDLLLLENYSAPEAARFRHYSWNEPAFTFGLSQNFSQTRATIPAECALVRRPTGGGVVSHLDDWTYTVVIPFAHRLCEAHATESYKAVHFALAEAFRAQSVPAALVPCPAECGGEKAPAHKPGICFAAPEIFDLVRPSDGKKIAGAAQKRNRHGLLMQGSIWKPHAAGTDWEIFEKDFVKELEKILALPAMPAPLPVFEKNLHAETIARFQSAAWNERI